MKKIYLLLLLNHLYCSQFYVLENREGAGMFSMFADVLAAICSYERGILGGFEVDFGERGLYWEKNYGPNWWTYYCEPLALGEKKNICRAEYGQIEGAISHYTFKNRHEAHALIEKYIRFQPDVKNDIESFVEANFKNYFVIGIHYRGTDAPASSPSYEIYPKKIKKILRSLKIDNYKIFIATDEQSFIDYMETQFPFRICTQNGVLRSSQDHQPVHFSSNYSRYKLGKEALTDCLLLAKSSFLLLAYSNLSLWASFFNPDVPVIDLSRKLPIINSHRRPS
jgi:hypothetical protein